MIRKTGITLGLNSQWLVPMSGAENGSQGKGLIPMLTPEQKAANARSRMMERAKQFQTTTYCRKVAAVFQRMIRAEAAADPRQYVTAVVDGEIRQVERKLGQCVCVTCGRVMRWEGKHIHTGHFLASRRNSILFEETNVMPQCAHCNAYQGGMPQEYRLWMRIVRGQAEIERLELLKTQSRSFTLEELVDLRIAYAARLAAAEERMKNG